MNFLVKPEKRVSIDNWYKNHDTGEFRQFLKHKNISAFKNFAKVELFDERSGRKKEEWLSENVVNSGLDQFAYRMVIANLLSKSIPSYAEANLFSKIFLTNYTGAEDATLKRVQGTVVGWADKFTTYAGADTLRGTINQSESSFTPETSIKFVFDWPTSAGNGTFQTIWWMPGFSTTITTSPYRQGVFASSSSSISLGTAMGGVTNRKCVVDNKLIYCTSTAIYSAVRYIVNTTGLFKTTSTLEKTVSSDDNTMLGIDYDSANSYFWLYGDQNDKFYKYNSSFTLQTSWSCAKATYFNSNPTFTVVNAKIFTFRRVDSTTWNLYKFSDTGTLENTYNLYSASYTFFNDTAAQSAKLCTDGTTIFIMYYFSAYNYCDILEVSTSGTVNYEYRADSVETFSSSTASDFTFDEYKNLIYSHSTTNIKEFCPMFRPVAQTLLGSGVTKTSSNTMKVTYTFTLDLSSLTS